MRRGIGTGFVVFATALAAPSVGRAQGIYLPGGGAVQGGMAGASSATPLDAIGALYWNPAAIGRLDHSEVSIGGAFIVPDIHVDSSFPQNGRFVSGDTRSDNGVGLGTSLGVVMQETPIDGMTYGLGLATIGGGGVNFPGSQGNPILSGPLGSRLNGPSIGPIYSNIVLLQMTPTVSYKVTDRLVVGLGPTIDVTLPSFNPAFFAPPNNLIGGGTAFPAATNARPYWGAGFRVGAVYSVTDTLDVGFGYTSPQWLEQWKFNTLNGSGAPETLLLQASLPAIYSWGIGYRGIDRLTLALDIRYFDYKDAELFGTSLRNGGLGWNSVFAVALGGQYQLTDRIAVRAGYLYNTNPIPSVGTLFNIQAPAITQNTLTFGTTMAMTDSVSMSVGYSYGLPNSITGPVREETGVGVKLNSSVQSLLFNVQIKFGGPARKAAPAAPAATYAPVSDTEAAPETKNVIPSQPSQ